MRGLLDVAEVYCDFVVRAVFGGFSPLRSEPQYLVNIRIMKCCVDSDGLTMPYLTRKQD